MSLNSVGRVALRVLGAYLIASGLIVLADGFNRPLVLTISSKSLLSSVFVSAFAGLVASTVFCVLPGLYLLVRGDSLADRFFPETAVITSSMDAEALLTVLVAVLGVFLLTRGIASLVGVTAILLASVSSDEPMLSTSWQVLASSLANLACGWFLLRWSRQRAHTA